MNFNVNKALLDLAITEMVMAHGELARRRELLYILGWSSGMDTGYDELERDLNKAIARVEEVLKGEA